MRAASTSILCLALATCAFACDSSEDTCSGATIFPSESPKALGPFRLRANNEAADPGGGITVPSEWTVFLQNTCGAPLKIDKVCLVGDGHNGDAEDPAFTLEGPVPDTVKNGDAAALRLTFETTTINDDRDDDGVRDPDNVAIVVQSNATNFPTLVIPVCALVVPADDLDDANITGCASPISVPAGKADRTLCK